MILSAFGSGRDWSDQDGSILVNHEGKKGSHGGHGGHGVAESVLQSLWTLRI
jgi:hypothetical protein